MYIQSIVFKREKDSEWEKGYYIGEYENSDKSFIINSDYVPITDLIWDYRNVYCDNSITLRCNDN